MMNDYYKNLKVVELSTYVAAPSAARIFADYGANVIKIEAPEGDALRKLRVRSVVSWDTAENPIWENYNSGKRCIVLDLKKKEGIDILFKLLEDADIFITNTRVKALKKMGIDYDSIKDRFPRLVYGLITGYGQEGPQADTPGLDTVTFWGMSGLAKSIVSRDSKPAMVPGSVGDATAGLALFGAICAALAKREKTGKGDLAETSLYSTAIWAMAQMNCMAQDVYGNKYPKLRAETTPLITTYKSKDEESFTITIVDVDKYFRPMCKALGIESLADDPRYKDAASILANSATIIPFLEETFAKFDYSEIDKKFAELNIPHERLRGYADPCKDEQAIVNGFVKEFTFDSGKHYVAPQEPIIIGSAEKKPLQRAGRTGEHTEEVLLEEGFTKDQIKELKDNGVI